MSYRKGYSTLQWSSHCIQIINVDFHCYGRFFWGMALAASLAPAITRRKYKDIRKLSSGSKAHVPAAHFR